MDFEPYSWWKKLVQMQHELPSAARGPATTMLSPGLSRTGSTPSFLSRVMASREAWLASAV
jgi:hypothetical protein